MKPQEHHKDTLLPVKKPQVNWQLSSASDMMNIFRRGQLGNRRQRTATSLKQRWNDPRITLVQHNYIHGKNVLDVGCGDGCLSLQFSLKYQPENFVGVDIDQSSISEANQNLNRFKQSQQSPLSRLKSIATIHEKLTLEVNQLLQKINQLPACFIKKISGSSCYQIEPIINDHQEQSPFPQNVRFFHRNIFDFEGSYDTVICFSVLKYIQLTLGDESIIDLFKTFSRLVKLHGHLILQVHPWSSYRKDKNNFGCYRRNFEKIKLRPHLFDKELDLFNFKLVETIKESSICYTSKKIIKIYKKQ